MQTAQKNFFILYNMPIVFVCQSDIMSTVPRGTQKKKGSKKSMKYEYLTRMINLIATTESEGRRVRIN